VVRLRLVGANRTPEVSGTDELPGKSHYLLGRDSRRWRRDVPRYARVSYHEVYPGVDLVYHGRQGQLEYDFVVSPGSDPRTIRIRLEGAGPTRLDDRGNLVVATSAGRLVQEAPVPPRRRPALVIDPALSTHVPGGSPARGVAIAVDDFGKPT
jgi:hypothetical protein